MRNHTRTNGATLALILLIAPQAFACGAPQAAVTRTAPTAGETWPANAAILLWGFGVGSDQLEVTVDGDPATLVAARGDLPGDLALRIEPPPPAGATVHLTGNPCPWQTDACEPIDLEFNAGPPDETPPPAPSEVFFDVFDHGLLPAAGERCQAEGDATFYVHVSVPPEMEPGWLRVLESPQLDGSPTAWHDATPGEVVVPLVFGARIDADWAAYCIAVHAVDPAGNRSPVVERCGACRVRIDEEVPPDVPAEEPAWTGDEFTDFAACGAAVDLPPDSVPPVASDDGTPASDAGGDAPGGDGERDADTAGCQAAPTGSASAVLALLSVLGWPRRRRKAAAR